MADTSASTNPPSFDESHNDDWDQSFVSNKEEHLQDSDTTELSSHNLSTPRNSIVFPGGRDTPIKPLTGKGDHSTPKRTLSELITLHAEKGTECRMSGEEAARLGDVLGQWINASSSPYEGEVDDFFKSHDDIALLSKRGTTIQGRSRGQSESAGYRFSNAIEFTPP